MEEHRTRYPQTHGPGTANHCCQRTVNIRRLAVSPIRRNSATAPLSHFSANSKTSATCCWIQFSRKAARLAWLCSCYASRRASRVTTWSWRRDLNPRPSDYKSDALPAELRQHGSVMALQRAWTDRELSRQPGTNTKNNTTASDVQINAYNELICRLSKGENKACNSPLPWAFRLGFCGACLTIGT